MKRIKAINGFTIYEVTARDEKNTRYTAGDYVIYLSSDIREYGREYSYPEYEDVDGLENAIALCEGSNYAKAVKIVSNENTFIDAEEVERVESLLDAGMTEEDMEEGEEMEEKILEVVKTLDDDVIVSLWNEYCYSTNRYDDEILDEYRLKEWIETYDDKIGLLNRFYFGSDDDNPEGSANPNRSYFCFNGYGNIISFSYVYNNYSDEFYHVDIDDLVSYIVENNEAFGVYELEKVLEA